MAKQNKTKNIEIEDFRDVDSLALKILLIALALIPILFHPVVIYFASPYYGQPYLSTGTHVDLGFYKFVLLGVAGIMLISLLIFKILIKGFVIESKYINIPVLFLLIILLVSCTFSQYKSIALFGQWYRHDGTLTYLLYLALLFVAANISYESRHYKLILYALCPLILVNVLLAVTNFYGYNILSVRLINFLLLGNRPYSQLNGTFNTTLENQNYMSGIGAVLTVLFLTKSVLTTINREKIWCGIVAVVSFTMVLASISTSGFLTIVISLPLIIVMILLAAGKKQALLTLAAVLLAFSTVFFTLNAHNKVVWNKDIGFLSTIEKSLIKKPKANPQVSKTTTVKSDVLTLPPKGVGAGDGRLFIWQKSLELIRKSPIVGYGLDTMAYYFPQDDPGLGSELNDYNTFVDKPHNIYLDIAYGAGMVGLLAFLLLICVHFIKYIKMLLERKISSERAVFLASMFMAFIAYLFQGLFNDSVLSTAPVFWILFGISVSLLNKEVREVTAV